MADETSKEGLDNKPKPKLKLKLGLRRPAYCNDQDVLDRRKSRVLETEGWRGAQKTESI